MNEGLLVLAGVGIVIVALVGALLALWVENKQLAEMAAQAEQRLEQTATDTGSYSEGGQAPTGETVTSPSSTASSRHESDEQLREGGDDAPVRLALAKQASFDLNEAFIEVQRAVIATPRLLEREGVDPNRVLDPDTESVLLLDVEVTNQSSEVIAWKATDAELRLHGYGRLEPLETSKHVDSIEPHETTTQRQLWQAPLSKHELAAAGGASYTPAEEQSLAAKCTRSDCILRWREP